MGWREPLHNSLLARPSAFALPSPAALRTVTLHCGAPELGSFFTA